MRGGNDTDSDSNEGEIVPVPVPRNRVPYGRFGDGDLRAYEAALNFDGDDGHVDEIIGGAYAEQRQGAPVPFEFVPTSVAVLDRDPDETDSHVRGMWRAETISAVNPKVVFSNFLLTFGSNIVAKNDTERANISNWFTDVANYCFNTEATLMSGLIIKLAGSDNGAPAPPDPEMIVSCRSVVAIEHQGLRGQVHMHVTLEVAHRYHAANANARGYRGIHVNVRGLREIFNGAIAEMPIEPERRRPKKIYVHNRLITRLNDNQAKFMTVQYLNKEVDKAGTDMRAQRNAASHEDQVIHGLLAQQAQEFIMGIQKSVSAPPSPEPAPQDDGGDYDFGGDGGSPRDFAPAGEDITDERIAVRRAARGGQRRPFDDLPSQSSFDPGRPARNTREIWTNRGRRDYNRRFPPAPK